MILIINNTLCIIFLVNIIQREKMFFIKKTLLILASVPMFLSATEYQLSTHVLDITSGQPAPKVKVELYKL